MNVDVNVQRRADINSALYEILSLSMEDETLEATLAKVLDAILGIKWLALAEKGCVFLADPQTEQLHMVTHKNLGESLLTMCNQISFDQCLCGKAARSQLMVFKSCVDHDHDILPEGIQPHGHYNVPVVHQGVTLAVINLYVTHGHQQQNDEIEFLQGASDVVAGIIRRKRAEMELKRANASLEEIIEQRTQEVASLARFPKENPFPVMRVCKDNLLIYANPASELLLFYTGYVVGEQLPDDCIERMNQARSSNQFVEYKIRAGKAWYSLIYSPSPNFSGEINIYGRDISVQVIAQHEKARLAAVVEQAEEIVVVTDAIGLIQYVNPAFEQISGYRADEVIGKSPAMVKSGKHDDAYYKKMWQKLRSGEVWRDGFINRAKDGSLYEVTQSISPICNEENEITGFAAVQHDVTEQRKAERKLQHADRVDSLGILAGGIAHDFNNLLAAILGNASLAMKKEKPYSLVHKNLENIKSAGETAADLCRQMLAYSGQAPFIVKPLNMSQIVVDMGKLISVSVSKSVDVQYQLHDQLPNIDADVAQMQQVVLNLIINASEAIQERGTITLATGLVEVDEEYLSHCVGKSVLEPGTKAYLEVMDSGCGMSEEVLQKIFDPFFTTKFTGRGLGMSAMLGIVQGHHGALRIWSIPDEGTRIRVILPISNMNPVCEIEVEQDTAIKKQAGTVLVVDDESMIREVATMMFNEMGFSVINACNGQEGVTMLSENLQDVVLVLLDMTMPVMDGATCFYEMRKINPNIKVLLSSGYDEQDAISRFAGDGLAGFAQKPYDFEQLQQKVTEVLAS